jgi:hypothetical protein
MPKNIAAIAAACAVASTSLAQDLTPKIDHQPAVRSPQGSVEIHARITSVSGKPIYQPVVMVRVPGITGFSRIPMNPVADSKDLFGAEVPASISNGDFDYYIEAFDEDGNGPARSGSPEKPIHVAVAQPSAGTAPPPPPPPGLLDGERLKFAGQDPRLMDKGIGKIVTGSILGALGVASFVTAYFAFSAASSDYAACPPDSTDGDVLNGVGYIFVIAGIALIAVGVTLIVVGAVHHSRYVEAMKTAGFEAALVPVGRDRTFAFSFHF